jgi:hypothetical protein
MKSNSEMMLDIFVSCLFAGISLAAGEGFEPGLTDPESVPLGYAHRYRPTWAAETALLSGIGRSLIRQRCAGKDTGLW